MSLLLRQTSRDCRWPAVEPLCVRQQKTRQRQLAFRAVLRRLCITRYELPQKQQAAAATEMSNTLSFAECHTSVCRVGSKPSCRGEARMQWFTEPGECGDHVVGGECRGFRGIGRDKCGGLSRNGGDPECRGSRGIVGECGGPARNTWHVAPPALSHGARGVEAALHCRRAADADG